MPRDAVPLIMEFLHNKMGHPGRDRTTSLIAERFYWPRMRNDIQSWIEDCDRCTKFKTPTNQRAELVSIRTSFPLELVCMDYLTIEPCKGGVQNILVMTDHFTKFAVAVPTRNQTAKTTADVFFNHFVMPYGLPMKIHSDQGANFMSKLLQELCCLTGISKSRTTPYHPMGNGITERFNRTLIGMLGTLQPDQKANWKNHIGPLVHAYNSTKHETTGFSPFYLMFGREPNLPIDLVFGLNQGQKSTSTSKYIEDLRQRLENAYEIANTAIKNNQGRQKFNYDMKVKGVSLHVGDRVLVKVVSFDGKHKIADKWEDQPYIIKEQPNKDIPVFKVQREDGQGRCKVLHRNLLLPIGSRLPAPVPTPRRSRIRKKKHTDTEPSVSSDTEDTNSDFSSSELDFIIGTGTNINRGTPDDQREDAPDDDTVIPQEEPGLESEPESETLDGSSEATIEDDEHQAEPDPIAATSPAQAAPRTSLRTRTKPQWTKDYVMSQQMTTPDWLQRATYLRKLIDDGTLQDKQLSTKALVSIVSGK